ncbi:hypothetical protein HY498_01640 [Candidatus Woesearchaeota archaeon]|nr:hypothetical protein [Candidatus Woesearchaeota archaeon]
MDKDLIKKTAGIWKGMNETGIDYENRVRLGWKKRLKLDKKGQWQWILLIIILFILIFIWIYLGIKGA